MKLINTRKALLSLLADGNFHSGADLAQQLGCSRTAVWGMIHELEQLHLTIHSISGKGYRLSHPLELLDEQQILAHLKAPQRQLLNRLEIYDVLDSTNTYLMTMTKTAASGTVCLAECQTAGRGRVGRSWQTPFGGSVCLSLLWHFEDHAALQGLSLAVGVAIHRALQRCGINGVGLKWPNDLLWQDRKLGGILLEVSGETHGHCAVVIGIGINIFMPDNAALSIEQAWTDLSKVTGAPPPQRNRLISLLLEELLILLADYAQRGLYAYLPEWRRYHCMSGRKIILHLGDKPIPGTVVDVNDKGLLLIDCEEGGIREFASGDVRLRLDEN